MLSSRAAETVTLGQTGVATTRLALGTVPLGGFPSALSERDAQEVLEAALELGIRYFDTAPLYGLGVAEERIGRFLARHGRESVTLATKVGRLLIKQPSADDDVDSSIEGIYPDAPPLVPVWNFSYEGARRSLEASYERLRTRTLDVVNIHDPDDHLEESLHGAYVFLTEMRARGLIRAVGAGMNQSAGLTALAREGQFDCFMLAGRYTLLDQSALADLLPVATARGIAILVGTTLHSGLLAAPVDGAMFNYRPAPREAVLRARELSRICSKYDVPLAAAALQFPLGHPAVASVVVGVRSRGELEENVRLFDWPIPDALWRDLKKERLLDAAAPVPSQG